MEFAGLPGAGKWDSRAKTKHAAKAWAYWKHAHAEMLSILSLRTF